MYLHIKCNNSSIWYAQARWNRINCTSNLFDFVASIWNWRFRGAVLETYLESRIRHDLCTVRNNISLQLPAGLAWLH